MSKRITMVWSLRYVGCRSDKDLIAQRQVGRAHFQRGAVCREGNPGMRGGTAARANFGRPGATRASMSRRASMTPIFRVPPGRLQGVIVAALCGNELPAERGEAGVAVPHGQAAA